MLKIVSPINTTIKMILQIAMGVKRTFFWEKKINVSNLEMLYLNAFKLNMIGKMINIPVMFVRKNTIQIKKKLVLNTLRKILMLIM